MNILELIPSDDLSAYDGWWLSESVRNINVHSKRAATQLYSVSTPAKSKLFGYTSK
jgi:hypothetical protein